MDEYPDPDEEYELMHQEELEAIREIEEEMLREQFNAKARKSKSSLNFDSPPDKVPKTVDDNDGLINDCNDLQKNKKRYLSMESLTDITSDLEVIERPTKKHKSSDHFNQIESLYECGTTSLRVPKWPFMPVTDEFGERLYVKINEKYDTDLVLQSNNNTTGLLVTPYSKLKSLAEETLTEKFLEKEERGEGEVILEEDTSDLWVEKYKPKTYFDLLSDEAVNRTLLNWLKMWDKIVFNKTPKNVKKEDNDKSNQFKDLDSDGTPHYKIALLCGPPGLGKTTLAHVVSSLAGYNTIEVNASDDRTVEAFNVKLDAATQMKSVMGTCKPNCLILDEIDGAPAPTIDFLLKYLNGKNSEKGKKGKKEKPSGVVKRPVICICNELYTPSLRQLRQQAFVVHFPHTSSTKLAQRLLEICRKQDIRTDISTLTLLCDKAQNDIRSCISTLHFFKTKQGQRFKSGDVISANVGQKDVQKGVFNMWKEIFHNHVKKGSLFTRTVNKGKEDEVSTHINYSKKGMEKLQYIVQMLQSSGEYERILQGVYENFLKSKFSGSNDSLAVGLEWFTWFDLLDTNIKKAQNFVLMPYLPYSFAAWHFLFSSNSYWKISYPSTGYENHLKEVRCSQILNDVLKGFNATVRSHNQRDNILLDVLPMFNYILVPPLRPVNPTLFNEKEKKDFRQLLDVMIDYNLNFIQQRSPDGTYFYQYDPNIEELTRFSTANQSNQRAFSYNMKQLISHEVELEKLRRAEESNGVSFSQIVSNKKEKTDSVPTPNKPKPFKLEALTPKEIKPSETEAQYKDFFGRVVKVKETLTGEKGGKNENNPVKSPVWFSFKEGYNNAVKKDITICDLL